jgi:transcriptional regulator with XRE-family HTH domain
MSRSENPFPSDDEVRFMADLSRQLLAGEFGVSLDEIGFDAEASQRRTMLAKCLHDAREISGWTLKFCAQALNAKPKQLRALEAGQFEGPGAAMLVRYVHFLGLEELYRQWLAANSAFAAQLGLSAPDPVEPRPDDWPMPKPFVLAPDTYRLSPEKRRAMQARLDAVKGLVAKLGGFGNDLLGSNWPDDPRQESAPAAVYQLKITLRHLKPAIWRRVQVPNDITLGQLHDVIQTAMGWDNCHLHEFRQGESRFGMTHDPMGGPLETDSLDENDYRLCELGLREKSTFLYEYDFGDSWEHQIVLEKVLSLPSGFVPACLKGARACPIEDSGGPWGYTENLAILADPNHPEHAELAEWMGLNFDPEVFDLEAINRRLASLSRSWQGEDSHD